MQLGGQRKKCVHYFLRQFTRIPPTESAFTIAILQLHIGWSRLCTRIPFHGSCRWVYCIGKYLPRPRLSAYESAISCTVVSPPLIFGLAIADVRS